MRPDPFSPFLATGKHSHNAPLASDRRQTESKARCQRHLNAFWSFAYGDLMVIDSHRPLASFALPPVFHVCIRAYIANAFRRSPTGDGGDSRRRGRMEEGGNPSNQFVLYRSPSCEPLVLYPPHSHPQLVDLPILITTSLHPPWHGEWRGIIKDTLRLKLNSFLQSTVIATKLWNMYVEPDWTWTQMDPKGSRFTSCATL